ncbi:MAG: hypothetical protein BGO67_10595 [Alphaproteobacteria bacterium 41-28]|nr:MAG: hypothetical protein BGO67_10595 [Alphaproteobacteria bacterium 41-28]
MAKLTLAQVEYLSQHLTTQFKDVKYLVSKASLELEMARTNLNDLLINYGQWMDEEGIDHERK